MWTDILLGIFRLILEPRVASCKFTEQCYFGRQLSTAYNIDPAISE